MKLIHCADIHLGATLKQHFSEEQSRERRNELLVTFEAMVEYGIENGVDAILISGDLFDRNVVPRMTGTIVKQCIEKASQIEFFYLRGNHDIKNFFSWEEHMPENLHLFSDSLTTYECMDVTISGIEINKENQLHWYEELHLEEDGLHIVMLHGDEEINITKLKNKNIDYLALGHIHSYQETPLDARGVFCYSGCLEGRGFDECGEKGFVLLTIKEDGIQREFIPFAKRQIHEIEIDVTGVREYSQLEERIEEALYEVLNQDMVRIVFTGQVKPDGDLDFKYFKHKYQKRYYLFEIKDKTEIEIDRESFIKDKSLKGEFLRLVSEQGLSAEEMKKIMELGVRALLGEEI